MKPRTGLAALVLVTVLPAAAQSQTSGAAAPSNHPVYRLDGAGALAWLQADKSELSEYSGWYHDSLYVSGDLGWYWTHHLKSEVEFGASTSATKELYVFERLPNNGALTRESTFGFTTRRVAISQVYQFYRNVTFHPFVAAGVDLTWEEISQTDGPEFLSAPPAPVQLQPARVHDERTEFHARPFAALGLKAYVSPRSFVRSDLRFVIRGGVDEVIMRFGMGIDF
jgi:hypothetical protein